MTDTPTLSVPIETDEHGVIHVSSTRVTVDSLLGYYRQGESPEDLHEGFPTVPLADIYAVIAYYLAHQEEIDAYLERRDIEAERIRQEVEANYSPETKARIEYFRELLAKKHKGEAS